MVFVFKDTFVKDIERVKSVEKKDSMIKYHNPIQFKPFKSELNKIDNLLSSHVKVPKNSHRLIESYDIRPVPTEDNHSMLPRLKRDLKFWSIKC